ncbi:MAG: family 43 glycosylhydrolase [Pseudarcicella sp.]|nr:family 43 glycosylhydrolase [Pseudarcicella sp.]
MKKTYVLNFVCFQLCIFFSVFSQTKSIVPRKTYKKDFYTNPIFIGKAGDPSIVRVGSHYYMTHSGGDYPSLPILHSTDLINWENIGFAYKGDGSPWAPDLVYLNGRFYIYVTLVRNKIEGGRSFQNYVFTSENPAGPWSDPIDLKVDGKIDPGHIVTSEGKRYLYFDKGCVAELSADGTKIISDIEKRYNGWSIPIDWNVECFCLESPKLFKKGDYYYLVSAQGGTTGPSTSHMAIVARSKSALGPWENSPLNPLIHTKSRDEKWWSQGHATLIEHTDGTWWAVFHAYENNYRTLGRQTLLLPVEWTKDNWPIIKRNVNAQSLIEKPSTTNICTTKIDLSDDFSSKNLNYHWRTNLEKNNVDNFWLDNNQLVLKAQDQPFNKAPAIYCMPKNHAYETTVQVTIEDENEAAFAISDQTNYLGIILKKNQLETFSQGSSSLEALKITENTVYLKLVNLHHDLALYYSLNGKEWTKFKNSFEVSHLKPANITLLAKGKGLVKFKEFTYKSID